MKRDIIYNIEDLRNKSEDVESKSEAERLIYDLEETLDTSKGIGLSAVQIGVYKKVAIIRWRALKLNLVNPKIIEKNDPFKFNECCLSLPGINVVTKRYKEIVYLNGLPGERKEYIAEGYESVIIQHEISHLQGRTILDDKWRKR